MENLAVVSYTLGRFRELLIECSESTEEEVDRKLENNYYRDYFAKVGAQTIVVERQYIDKDYLEDYCGYYARCFETYSKLCTRLHFFRDTFEEPELANYFLSPTTNPLPFDLRAAYLGFMVIKPLPNTFIGRTCLVTYPLEGGRVFPALRPYTSNLFGLNLSASSLAFQEQDSTVAACATESLWSAFQMTASIFDHSIPSPFTITSIATKQVSSQSRSFPNKGLTPEQMGRAISEYELEPYFIQLDPTFNERRNQLEILQNNLYAYVSAGIPMLFLHYLHPLKEALHSATIAGFCLSEARTRTSFNLRSERINKFYAHDDRVGPFARFEIHDDVVNEGGKERWVIRTSLSTPDYAVGTVRAIPHLLLAPLYHKIRVPFQMVYEAIFEFDAHIGPVIQELAAEIPKGIEWDIKLTTVNKYKATLFASDTQDRRVLFKPLPRFIWQASALDYRDEKRCLFEILFDATDLEQGKLFLALVEHDEATFIPLAAALKGQEARVADPIARRIVAAFGAKSGDLGVA